MTGCLTEVEYIMESKQILLINDLPGYGKVALAAMMPVLAHMGHILYTLPTALVSNTLDYGQFEIMETTEYIKNTLKVWKNLGFQYDAIATGFIVSEEQAQLIAHYCEEQKKQGTLIFTDPIMGDDGKLYNGVTESALMHMKHLTACADVIVPNYTEACLLAGVEYKAEGIDRKSMVELIEKLRQAGSKSIIITSAVVEGQDVVCGYEHKTDSWFMIPFHKIPVRFPGIGDIFSSLVLGHMLHGMPLKDSVKQAMDMVAAVIARNAGNEDKYKGIPLETELDMLK